jgi:hypothetical protein
MFPVFYFMFPKNCYSQWFILSGYLMQTQVTIINKKLGLASHYFTEEIKNRSLLKTLKR